METGLAVHLCVVSRTVYTKHLHILNALFLFILEDDLSTTSTVPPESLASQEKVTSPAPRPPEPCNFTNLDENVLVFNGTDSTELSNYSLITFPHDSLILIRCKDIGKFQLTGPKERLCRNGVWSPEGNGNNHCTGLNQAYEYDGMRQQKERYLF